MSDSNSDHEHTPIHGGCLCQAIRYTINFPKGSAFPPKPSTCQCTQCRKNAGALIVHFLNIDSSQLVWTTTPPTEYESTPKHYRGFCNKCGSWLTWKTDFYQDGIGLITGTVDEEFLLGPDGPALTEPTLGQYWCCKVVKGVTDKYLTSSVKWYEGETLGRIWDESQ